MYFSSSTCECVEKLSVAEIQWFPPSALKQHDSKKGDGGTKGDNLLLESVASGWCFLQHMGMSPNLTSVSNYCFSSTKEMVPVVGDRGLVDWMDSVNGRLLTVKHKQEIHKLGAITGLKVERNVCFSHFTKLSLMPCDHEKLLVLTTVDLCACSV